MSHPRHQILAEAGRAFGATFDPIAAPWNVAQFLVPRLADWSFVGLLGSDESIDRVAHAHVDPRCAAQLGRLARIVPARSPTGRAYAITRVLRSGRPFLVGDAVQRPDLLPGAFSGLRTRALLVVPLGARRRPAGIIVLGSSSPGHFDLADARLAAALALRAGIVFDIARRCDQMQAQSASLANMPGARRRQRELAARAHRRAELTRQWIGHD
jgi:GAF domain-containing protein